MAVTHRLSAELAKTLATMAPDPMARKLHDPYFFVGCGRSGTSWLATLLRSHEDIAGYPYEANELWHPRAFPWALTAQRTPPFWADPDGFTEASLANRTAEDDRRLKAVFGAYQFAFRGKVFLNKSVMITFMVPKVMELFPGARFLHVYRDGRAVALSWAILERSRIDAHPEPFRRFGLDLDREALLEKFAEHWTQHILEIERQKARLDLVGRGLLHELRYEDLCADPARTLSRIAQFMKLDPHRFAGTERSVIKDTNVKYRKELPASTIERISSIMRPALTIKHYV
jgi:hypothetical protein